MALPLERPATVPVRALPYHRLTLAWPSPAWWRPLIGALIGVGLYLGVVTVASLVVLVALILPIAVDPTSSLDDVTDTTTRIADMNTPFGLAFTLGAIIPMLPAALIGFRLAGGRPMGLLSSVAGRVRWRWLLWCALPALAAVAVSAGVGAAVDALTGVPIIDAGGGGPALPPLWWLSLLLTLVLVPFQAAAEEYAFRGVLMQTLGSWLRHPAWAILLPVPLFVFGHLYDPIGLITVGIFAVVAGWITWRTGGLEAAIALHVVNNLVGVGVVALGLSDGNATAVSIGSLVGGIVGPVGFALWVAAVHGRWVRRGTAIRERPLPPPVVFVPPGPLLPPTGIA